MLALDFQKQRPILIALAAITCIYGVALVLSQNNYTVLYPELAMGVLVDLAIVSPIVFYLAIRKSSIPRASVFAVMYAGIGFAYLILPANQSHYSSKAFLWLLPVAETILAVIVLIKIRGYLRIYSSMKPNDKSVREFLEDFFLKAFGSKILAGLLAFEVSMIRMALFSWKQPKQNGRVFTYHKTRGTTALYAVTIFLTLSESIVLHILIADWNIWVAWLFTASSLYFALILIAQIKACYLRPIRIVDQNLLVRSGLFCDARIPLSDIVSAKVSLGIIKKNVLHAGMVPGLETTNVLIELAEECHSSGFLGRKQSFRRIALFADDSTGLLQKLNHES